MPILMPIYQCDYPQERARRCWLYNLATKPGHEGMGYATALIDTYYDKVNRHPVIF